MSENFLNNEKIKRFELDTGEATAFTNYRLEGQTLFIDYVEAPPVLRGTGAAGRLMQHIADLAQSKGYKMVPICGYAAAWISRNVK